MATLISDSVSLVFHNVEYVITITTTVEESLIVEVEQTSSDSQWRGEFTANYIEEITRRTGNYKKFSVFVRMLQSSLHRENDSVFVDLLTYSDLEILKKRKMKTSTSSSVSSSTTSSHIPSKQSSKRYLILTYAVEFDRVHYPLPLAHLDSPDVPGLKRTVARLRKELAAVKSSTNEQEMRATAIEKKATMEENRLLKEKVQLLEEELQARDFVKEGKMTGRKDRLDAERLEEDNRVLRLERENLQTDLEELRGENEELRRKLRKKSVSTATAQDTAQELASTQRKLKKAEQEIKSLKTERSQRRKAEEKLRADVRLLEDRLRQSKLEESRFRKRVTELSGELRIAERRRAASSKRTRDGDLDRRRSPLPTRSTSAQSRTSSVPTRKASPSTAYQRARSPGSFRRFDPTAYIKEREEKLRMRSAGNSPSSRPPSHPPSRQSPREHSSGRRKSTSPKIDMRGKPSRMASPTGPSGKRSTKSREAARVPSVPKEKQPVGREREESGSSPLRLRNATEDIADIDKRLEELQQFLRKAKLRKH